MQTFPIGPSPDWMESFDGMTSRLFGRDDYELYEEDGEFVLTTDMPGFESNDINLRWHDGRLNVAAEREDDHGRTKTYHRNFRFLKEIDEDGITAEYRNGVLEVELPIVGPSVSGEIIDVE